MVIRRQAIVRATAQSVPFSVATGRRRPCRALGCSVGRDWKVVQFDVDVSSR